MYLLRIGDIVVNLANINQIALVSENEVQVAYADGRSYGFSDEQATAFRAWLLDMDNVAYCEGSGGSF